MASAIVKYWTQLSLSGFDHVTWCIHTDAEEHDLSRCDDLRGNKELKSPQNRPMIWHCASPSCYVFFGRTVAILQNNNSTIHKYNKSDSFNAIHQTTENDQIVCDRRSVIQYNADMCLYKL